jgi:2,4-dienoyl-CoA reductase-like NADH-dependent reductase (Old Yellow Enzyme family)
MPPIKTAYGNTNGEITPKHIQFYVRRAKYIGAIIPEPFYIDKGLRELPVQIGIHSDEMIDGLKLLAHAIHQGGAKAIAHLNHPGRMANPVIKGNYFLSATDQACENGGAKPQIMTKDEIAKAIELWKDAAVRAEKAGFDALELQFGYGYLVAQFLSPKVNIRTDEYGGSFENRSRLALDVFDTIKKSVNIPLIVRLSASEMLSDGIQAEEMIELAKILKNKGVEAIHVTLGSVCSTAAWYYQHMFVPKKKSWELAAKIKKNADVPVIFMGQINTADDIHELETEFNADYIALGRAMVADPDFVGKYTGQIKDIIRPCLACSDGCLGGVKTGRTLHCLVNPEVGEDEYAYSVTQQAQKIAVVGAGLAGMEAALQLNMIGHEVTIFEKEQLGGQFNLAYLPNKKNSLKKLVDFYISQIEKRKIKLINKEAEIMDLSSFDGVILASGSKPIHPQIEGLNHYVWAEVLEERNLPHNKNILIIGGGLIGTEVAHHLLLAQNKVSIVEMIGQIARGIEMIEGKFILQHIKEANVPVYLNTQVVKVEQDKVFLEGDNEMILENIDLIVLAAGMKPFNPLEEELKKQQIKYMLAGDAFQVAKAEDAIRSGRLAAIVMA